MLNYFKNWAPLHKIYICSLEEPLQMYSAQLVTTNMLAFTSQVMQFPSELWKASAPLLSHKMIEVRRGTLLKTGSLKAGCLEPRRIGFRLSPKTETPQPAWPTCSLTCVSYIDFIHRRHFTEATSTFISTPHQPETGKCADSKSSETAHRQTENMA